MSLLQMMMHVVGFHMRRLYSLEFVFLSTVLTAVMLDEQM